jgi:hypothetical protein
MRSTASSGILTGAVAAGELQFEHPAIRHPAQQAGAALHDSAQTHRLHQARRVQRFLNLLRFLLHREIILGRLGARSRTKFLRPFPHQQRAHQTVNQSAASCSQMAKLLRILAMLGLQHTRHRKQIAVEPDGAHQIPSIVKHALALNGCRTG